MTQNKLIHILGGGKWQVPTVRLAKSLGYRVLVTDIYAERPAYALADFHEVIDITDREATLAVARRHQIDGILCDTTDVGVPTAAYVADRLGLPGIGYETALNCTNKGRMRQLTDQAGLTVPRYRLISNESELNDVSAELGYPLIVKPVDNQSGRGVSKVFDRNGLDMAYIQANSFSRSGNVIIETCVQGTEIIVDGFIVNNDLQILGVAEKIPYEDSETVSSRIHYSDRFSLTDFQCIQNTTRSVMSALSLNNGVFHAEFIIHGNDVIPIDIAARGGGCMIYSHVIPHVSGVDVNRAMIKMAMGEPVKIEPLAIPKAANIEFMRMPTGILSDIIGVEAAVAIPGVAAVHFNLNAGDHIGPLEHKDHRPGYVVALADTTEEVIEISLRAKSLITVKIVGNDNPFAIE